MSSDNENCTISPGATTSGTAPDAAGIDATIAKSQSISETKTELQTASAGNPKSLDQTSKLSLQSNPFKFLASLKPADQSTETVVEACVMLAESVAGFWRQYGSWLSELKRRMEVRNGSKGKQLPIAGTMLYWHEFLTKYFKVSRRHINRIEKEFTTGTYKPLLLVEGDRVVTQAKDGHSKDGAVTKVHQSTDKVDVNFGDGKTETVAVADVSKAAPPRLLKLKLNCLYVDQLTHVQFRYTGDGVLVKNKEQPAVKQVQEAEALEKTIEIDHIKAKSAQKELNKQDCEAEPSRKGSLPVPVEPGEKSPRYLSAKCCDADLYGLFNIVTTGAEYTKSNAVFLHEKAAAVEGERLARVAELKKQVVRQ